VGDLYHAKIEKYQETGEKGETLEKKKRKFFWGDRPSGRGWGPARRKPFREEGANTIKSGKTL